jgi:hypothetical protein
VKLILKGDGETVVYDVPGKKKATAKVNRFWVLEISHEPDWPAPARITTHYFRDQTKAAAYGEKWRTEYGRITGYRLFEVAFEDENHG